MNSRLPLKRGVLRRIAWARAWWYCYWRVGQGLMRHYVCDSVTKEVWFISVIDMKGRTVKQFYNRMES